MTRRRPRPHAPLESTFFSRGLSVGTDHPDAVRQQDVKMGVEVQAVSSPLHDAQAGHQRLDVGRATALPGGEGVVAQAHHRVQDVRAEGQEGAQLEGKADDDVAEGHGGEDVVHKVCAAIRHVSRATAWAQGPGLAGKRNDLTGLAAGAHHAGEAAHGGDPAAQVGAEGALNEPGQPLARLLAHQAEEAFQVLAHNLVEDGVFGTVSLSDGHGAPQGEKRATWSDDDRNKRGE
jgi:hypothetical protein